MARRERIDPRIPTGRPKQKQVPSTPEERAFARNLHETTLPGEWRAIARRVTREFGIQRTERSIRSWITKGHPDDRPAD